MFIIFAWVLGALIVSSCSPSAAPAPPPVDTPPVVEPAVQSDAVTRADALLAEMKRNEVAFAKMQSEAPKPVAAMPPQMNQPSATGTPNPAQPMPSAPQPSAPVAVDGKDETWWKDRARSIGLRLEDAERMVTASAIAVDSATLRITQDEARAALLNRVAAVRTIRAELVSLQEDARRANVPPGWLRWP